MTNQLLQIRKLTENDYDLLNRMETGIEDDYVVRIFPKLINSHQHELYGLFHGEQMLSVAGYSIYLDQYAMLGRLRSDKRFLGKGHATELLKAIIKDLKTRPDVKWIGANTEIHNKPALKVLEKLGFPAHPPLYPVKLYRGETVQGTPGPKWEKLQTKQEKRHILNLFSDSDFEVFPYECYYPFPYQDGFLSDDDLEESLFFANKDRTRFFIMKEDQKKELYAMVMYPWNDHFEQAGFWDTVMNQLQTTFTEHRLWIDFMEEGLERAKNLDTFEIRKPWVLHGVWKDIEGERLP
ncbi:Acetyltransferase (GNAT) family protein [Salinibacillus kushneri]|uniref:Acetyltransferase (GNAT) family protein n=1 Tax=Salinibacillus kushneri TaxID=237682 RepID=A0A1H9YJK6_9BACI|nr:GNAT family N-acetyltransferase [Salinibacillus kushneri]SES69251.1 Acetyltransferase (GNAT) family protein [Salinibacillus kushneri]